MEPEGVSGTVTISDQRSYIEIESLGDKNPTEIHGALSEVCGEVTVNRSMVSRSANRFRGGCVSIDTDPRPGRPRTSTMKEVWSLWQMLLKKIVVLHVKNFLEPREQKLHMTMHKNRPQLLMARPLILHDNAHPHITDVVTKKLGDYGWEVLPHALSSRDRSPLNLELFPKLKEPMCGRHFSSLEELSTDGILAIRHMNKSGVLDEIIMIPKRWDSVIKKQEDYIQEL